MKRVLFIGEEPEAVDYSSTAPPPGTTAAKIRAGIDAAMSEMKGRGWSADLCLIQPDDTAVRDVAKMLRATPYDCIVIGGGIRLPPPSLNLFEAILNTVHALSPDACMAFNTRPEGTADAVARAVQRNDDIIRKL